MEKIVLIRHEDIAALLIGQAKIVNIPPGCKVLGGRVIEGVRLHGLLRERFADYGMMGVRIEHPSFTDSEQILAAVVEGAGEETTGDIPLFRERAA